MSFTKTITLPVTPDEAFALLTQPERLRRWQTVSASVDLRAGGSYSWTVTPTHTAGGKFHEVEPGRRIVFGWGWDGSDDLAPDASTVTVTMEPTDGGTQVTLLHEGLTAEQAQSHAEGWNHYFERLERLVTTGDAGPDEWAFAPEQLNHTTASYAALASLQPVLRRLTAEDKPKQTPCADFTCHDLAEHLMGSMIQLGAMAGVEVVKPEDGSLENKVSVLAGQAIEAWRSVDLNGSVEGPGGAPLPASFLAGVLPIELLLHGWDFAQATGQQLHVSDEVVRYVRDHAETIVPASRDRGAFAAEVLPPADANALDRLAAFAGRNPAAA